MTKREQQLARLEELCQQRYAVIDHCYREIAAAQHELSHLEAKYLKLKAKIDNPSQIQIKSRLSKIDKLRKDLKDLGLEENEILSLLKGTEQ